MPLYPKRSARSWSGRYLHSRTFRRPEANSMMLVFILIFTYLSIFFFVLGFMPLDYEARPTLEKMGLAPARSRTQKKKRQSILRLLANVNKPLCKGNLRKRITKDLAIGHVDMSPEEFILLKEAMVVALLFISFPTISPDMVPMWLCFCFVAGYILPEFWLKGKIKRVKEVIVKELPDAIDLLGLCVNAGLDFMLSLKWVVEKSPKSVM